MSIEFASISLFLNEFPRASITFTFKAMGSRQRPPPATWALPERGIGVGLWAADFDGPSRSRVEQLHLPSFGVPRRLVHVRHWRCALFSERLRAAADTLQERVVATPIEREAGLHPAHEPDRPDLPGHSPDPRPRRAAHCRLWARATLLPPPFASHATHRLRHCTSSLVLLSSLVSASRCPRPPMS